MLKPKGLIFIYTMSLDSWTYRIFGKHWYYIDPIGHLYYFSDRTIQRLMEEVGVTFLGKEFDNSKSMKLHCVLKEFAFGIQNHIVFYAYRTDGLWQKAVRKLLEMVYNPIPEERIKKRMENFSPYLLPVRYKDDFIYVCQKNG
jgi:ABC-type ATPase with predicted acetyltransferase domain